MKVKIQYLHEGMERLKRAHTYDAGADVYMYKDTVVKHGKNIIPLGFKIIIPPGYAGYLSPRSSVMGDGVIYNMTPIDADYSGEWHMIVYNTGEDFLIHKNERLCQVVIMPVFIPEFVERESEIVRRGSNGLGSTGK